MFPHYALSSYALACAPLTFGKLSRRLGLDWRSVEAPTLKIHQRGVQWKQGVVIYMMLYFVYCIVPTPVRRPSGAKPLCLPHEGVREPEKGAPDEHRDRGGEREREGERPPDAHARILPSPVYPNTRARTGADCQQTVVIINVLTGMIMVGIMMNVFDNMAQ